MQRPPHFGFNTLGQVIATPHKGGRNITIIAAMDCDNGIGMENGIPWSLPPDMQQFKRLTSGNPVIMGRKTHESLPYSVARQARILPGRENVVISRNTDYLRDNKHPMLSSVRSLADALHLVGDRQIFIIGGAEIYQQALMIADDMILTRLEDIYIADVKFPQYNREEFLPPLISHHEYEGRKFSYSYVRRRQHI